MRHLQRVTIAVAASPRLDWVTLTPEQHHYLHRVLRLQSGDHFLAVNGQGQQWLAQLQADLYTAQLVETVVPASTLPLLTTTLITALPKGTGFDEVVRQATELGVTRILPVISDRTLLKPSAQRLDRWRRIAAEAAEQSERLTMPEIAAVISFDQAIQAVASDSPRYLCVARRSAPPLLQCALSQPHPVVTVGIGPEGGWTEAEIESAIAAGFQLVSLGHSILRAVTAPLTALALLQAAWELTQGE